MADDVELVDPLRKGLRVCRKSWLTDSRLSGVESPQETAQIKAKRAIAVISKTVFHDFPNISRLKEAMKQQHMRNVSTHVPLRTIRLIEDTRLEYCPIDP